MRPVQLIAAFAAGFLSISQVLAQSSPPLAPPPPKVNEPTAAVAAAAPAHALTKADLDSWLDGFMPYALRKGDIAGAVVTVVKDGEVLSARGYGYADVKERKPVDPDTTLFRIGSVSKLFTWTSVMQLVEQGKLDLDADVNTYIDFKIPARDGKPVTLRNLMTHTAGFEEQLKGLIGVEADGIPALDEHLKRWTPGRVFAPGSTPAYSNYGAALAGYIVGRVAGMSFDDYVDKHIFEPLGMQYATFRQPLPEKLRPYMAKGYPAASLPEKPFEIVGPAPAGSVAASGADMARFMIAHLHKGSFGAKQILKPETAQLMHDSALTILPRVNRMLLGFYETNYNGHRAIGHGGDTQWFHSDLHLFIDDDIGIFVSVNSPGKDGAAGGLRSELFEEFADRYLPGESLDGKVDAKSAADHARMIAGSYLNSRRVETSFISLLNLGGEVKVFDAGDGTISVSMVKSPSGVPVKWREVEPFVWRKVDGKELLSGQVENGRVTRFSFGELSPFMIFERPVAWKSPAWLLPLLIVGFSALLLSAIAWPVSALTRRHYRASYVLAGQDAKAHRLVRIASVAVVIALLAWGITIVMMLSEISLLSSKMDWWLRVLQVLAPFAFFGGAAVGLWNAFVVVRGPRKWYAKLWAVVLAVGFVASLWVALVYKLIGFGVNY
jgi:CubicO group peptidase (beta-lactamase class C family)